MSLPAHLAELHREIRGYAQEYGLDTWEIIFEMVSTEEMNMVAAFGGFPTRYPHWRFGMEFDSLSKGHTYGLQKIYELVINTDPCYAYLMESNSITEQKVVMAHVYGHCDFFKNNVYFSHTNRRMLDQMANHASRIRRYIDRHGIEVVEGFLDRCLSLENLIDPMSVFAPKKRRPANVAGPTEPEHTKTVRLIPTEKSYLRPYINPKEFIEAEKKKIEDEKKRKKRFPEEPARDVLAFMMEHAPLDNWQRDCIDIVREEAYYFSPQAQTKIMNEGWACLVPDTRVQTERGLITMADLVRGEAGEVFDGETRQRVYDRNIIRDHATVRIKTRRGFDLEGSNNHRVMLAGGEWRRLDELTAGDRLRVGGGAELWPAEPVKIDFQPPRRITLGDVAEEAGVSVWTVLRHRAGQHTRSDDALARVLEPYELAANQELPLSVNKRVAVRIPSTVGVELGAFLGYLVGDGHISRKKRNLGLTTGDDPQAQHFLTLARDLFGVLPVIKKDGNRWRVLVHSETVSDLLVDGLGLTHGPSAREKQVPEAILRSPEPVVRAFLSAYFDCDGHAGKQGVILSTTSVRLAEQVQLLLLNYGILSRRRRQSDGGFHLHVTGASAKRFAERIGFGLARKQQALLRYVADHRFMKRECWEDEVVAIEEGRSDVYDISVTETHRYAAGGFINHNSFWHSKIMTTRALRDSELIDYAHSHAATMGTQPGRINPYKLGVELFRHIEERWNKGQFGKDWEECDDFAVRKRWDKQLGLGRKKIFEVRKIYNDVTFIDEFLTDDFAREQKLFTYGVNRKTNNWEIQSREFREIKKRLLFSLTNSGQPRIAVLDGNWENRGELLLVHMHEGVDLQPDWARDTLSNLHAVWGRPVSIATKADGKGVVLRYDGRSHSEKASGLVNEAR